jgi:hypothetical protein
MKTFRNNHPQRTYVGQRKSNYQHYRQQLAEDFNHRCGYTDSRDIWWGAAGFEIDHFAPLKPKIKDAIKLAKFTSLKTEYKNLVYSCPQINRAKSNDWASDDPDITILEDIGYYDPCQDFNVYFYRTDSGQIMPHDDPVAAYMWNKLKLYLKRYEFCWKLDQLHDRKTELRRLHKLPGLPEESKADIERAVYNLDDEFTKYLEYLTGNYSEITN